MHAFRQALLFGFAPIVGLWAQGGPGVEQEITTLSEQWMRAVWEHEDAALNRLMVDDFIYSAPSASVKQERKQEWLAQFSGHTGPCSLTSTHIDSFGEEALMASEMSCPTGWLGLRTHAVVADLWVRRGGQWRVATRVANGIPRFGWWLWAAVGSIVPLGFWAWTAARNRSRQRGSLMSVANRY